MYDTITTLPVIKNEEVYEMYRNWDDSKREKLIRHNIRMVFNIAHRYYNNSPVDFNDLVQEGIKALVMAVDRYDVSTNAKFSVFAYRYINGYILNLLKKDENFFQKCDNQEIGRIMDQTSCHDEDHVNKMDESNIVSKVNVIVEQLKVEGMVSPKEAMMFNEYYVNNNKKTLREIGETYDNVTPQNVMHHVTKVLGMVRERIIR